MTEKKEVKEERSEFKEQYIQLNVHGSQVLRTNYCDAGIVLPSVLSPVNFDD